ncbi:MAG: alkaline phosphatase family protein [Acidobacteriota bacterium]|nr:alkaline phosphatase family protein [Acidobacteriota bacterium]
MRDYRSSIEGWSQVHPEFAGPGCCEPSALHEHGADANADEDAQANANEGESSGARAVAGVTRARRLLICLDGVPLEVVRMARARGMFEFFREPSALLSPFPTMTNVALASMFRATPPQGYESLYFDRGARALRGGIGKYIGPRTPDKVPSSYMDELDYQEPLPFEFLVYVAPDAVWRADVRRFRERFDAAPRGRDFFAFLKATDGLLHCRGTERLLVALQSLDKVLRDVRAHCGDETEIVLFSDHGMNLEENRRIHLQTHLRDCGFEITDHFGPPDVRSAASSDRARARRSVAAPAFGLCGYAALYCARETDPAWVAAALSSLEGVDFSVHRDGADVTVRGARGTARIRREETAGGVVRFAYEASDGDPLALAPVREALAASGELDSRGFATDRAWLARTGSHAYPDALANLHGALHGARVRHTADVLVSTLDGYYYGATAFGHMVRLRATHGNAMRPSTHAFLMSTHRAFPPHVRATEAQPLLRG